MNKLKKYINHIVRVSSMPFSNIPKEDLTVKIMVTVVQISLLWPFILFFLLVVTLGALFFGFISLATGFMDAVFGSFTEA